MVDPFNQDVLAGGGYRYTTEASLSSRLANARMTQASLRAAPWHGARAIDIGCGDGTYTAEILSLGHPASVSGIDPAPAAVAAARERHPDARLSFNVGSAYDLPHGDAEFDLGYLRGVLHHVDRPTEALREAVRVARAVVVVEPNGYNPGLKLLERVSSYHREHGERSHPASRLDRWAGEAGGRVVWRAFVGFVPMFSPDPYARAAKVMEPLLERLPGVRRATCAQYVFTVARD